jgi:hypothetical protein
MTRDEQIALINKATETPQGRHFLKHILGEFLPSPVAKAFGEVLDGDVPHKEMPDTVMDYALDALSEGLIEPSDMETVQQWVESLRQFNEGLRVRRSGRVRADRASRH